MKRTYTKLVGVKKKKENSFSYLYLYVENNADCITLENKRNKNSIKKTKENVCNFKKTQDEKKKI